MTPLRIALSIGAAAACVAVGILIGRSQSEPGAILHGEGVEERLVAILMMREPLERARALAVFFQEVHPSEFEVVDEVYKRRYFPADDAVARVLYASWWARFDPTGAFEGRRHDPLGDDNPWARAVAREWTRRDPAAAQDRFDSFARLSPLERFGASLGAIDGWFDHADTDPDELLVLFEGLRDLRRFNDLIRLWVQRMVDSRGVETSLDYAESMPEDKLGLRVKRELMGRLAARVVTIDLERAMVFAEENMTTKAGTKVAYYMVGAWARLDGPSAIRWAMPFRLPNSHKVVERAWKNFLLTDPGSAVQWIESQPASPDLEPAYALYVARVATEDHRRALALAEQIQDERRLNHARQAIGRAWIVKDPAGAEAWLGEVDLPEKIEERIRAVKPRVASSPGSTGTSP